MRIIDRVESFLKTNPKYRNSDRLLMLDYWYKQGLELSKEQRTIFLDKCTTPESITRARRLLMEKYPASKEVEDERFTKFQQYKNERAVSWLND
jgi:hypothetical protein